MDPKKRKSRIQTVVILALVFTALYYFFAEIPFVSQIDKTLPAIRWSAQGGEEPQTEIRIQGERTLQLRKDPSFTGFLEIGDLPHTHEESGNFTYFSLADRSFSSLPTATLRYHRMLMGGELLGNIYTNSSFDPVIIILSDQESFTAYVAPARTEEDAYTLLETYGMTKWIK